MTGALTAVAGMPGRSRTAPVGGAPVTPDTFADWLASTNGDAGPDHYWLLDDTSGTTVTTETGGLTGTYINTSDLELGIEDEAAEKWVGFGGVNGAINILNPITTAAFTIMFRLQFDAAPSQMTLATSAFASTAGQYLIQADTDGASGLKPRVGRKDSNGASVVFVGTNPGTIPVGTALHYFYICRSDGTQEVWIHDIDAGTVSQIALTLNQGTAPGSWDAPPSHTAWIGSATNGTTVFNGVMSHLAVWDVALDASDILALEAVSPQPEPVVVSARDLDAGEVNESAALAGIDVSPFVHPSTGITVSVVDGTGTHGTLTTDGTDLTYTANSVTGNQTDGPASMTWRVTKDGVSADAGFTIDVLEAAASESEQANCFVESSADTVVIGSGSGNLSSALQSAINAAPAGRQILIASGSYTLGTTVTINRDGTEADPIVIRPQSGIGTVTITSGLILLANTSSWVTISKLQFTGNGRIRLHGDHNRVTRCKWSSFSTVCVQLRDSANDSFGARNCRIDHCEFSGPTGTTNAINYGGSAQWNNNVAQGPVLIDYCYFHDFSAASGASAIEGFGYLENFTVPRDGYFMERGSTLTVDHCLFHMVSMSGEFITSKLGGAVWRFCTFTNLNGYFQFRAGNNCELRSCWFEGAGIDPLHIWGKNQLVIGNRFMNTINVWVPPGHNTADLQRINTQSATGGANTADDYIRAEDSQFIGNRFASGHLQVGQYWNPTNLSFQAVDNVLEANTRDAGGSAHEFIDVMGNLSPPHTGTTVSGTTSEAFTPAVKLTSSDVGVAAADPLCA